MKNKLLHSLALWAGAALAVCATPAARGQVEVDTLGGGPRQGHPAPAGTANGNTYSEAQFNTPWALALDSSTNIYVADKVNNRIRRISNPGNYATSTTSNFVTSLSGPVGVAVVGDSVYVLTQTDGRIRRYSRAGALLGTVGPTLTSPTAFAIDSVTNIYVTQTDGTVRKVSPNGNSTLVATGLNQPKGLVLLTDTLLAVSDSGNNAVKTINVTNGAVTLLAGGSAGFADGPGASARFNQPHGLAKTPNGALIVADRLNHRYRLVSPSGTVSTLAGIDSTQWQGSYPGWVDGDSAVAASHDPVSVVVAENGSVYSTEVYYHLIRQLKISTGPALPPVSAPTIGWVDIVKDSTGSFVTKLVPVTSSVFNNAVTVAIKGEEGSQTYYTFGPTPRSVFEDGIPFPTSENGATPPLYRDGRPPEDMPPSLVDPQGDLTVKAIGTGANRASSPMVQARFIFQAGNPSIIGDNAASFQVANVTGASLMYYTIDGSDPTNTMVSGGTSMGPVGPGESISIPIGDTNVTLRIRAFKNGYKPSDIVSKIFTPGNFRATSISFGFEGGEASSEFIAAAGQRFFAPVTLSPISNQKIYSLQFNLTVTNVGGPALISPGMNFQSMLMAPIPGTQPPVWATIPPAMAVSPGKYQSLLVTNNSINLLGVGWLERLNRTNLYDTLQQDLISYSMAHDNLFESANGRVILGGYSFLIPTTAEQGQVFKIQIDRPSATSDGIRNDVYIRTPTNGSLTAGSMNATKNVRVGSRQYVVGDCAPFRWFNAGDFGEGTLLNNDVLQVFQSAVYALNTPPPGSDFFDGMDSSNGSISGLFDGNDTLINDIRFGDGKLAVDDVYVTFRRSIDPSLKWYARYWSNGVRQSVEVPNVFRPDGNAVMAKQAVTSGTRPAADVSAHFSVDDAVIPAGAGTIIVPIRAQIKGGLSLKTLMMNVNVTALDGAPNLTVPIQFNAVAGLGQPAMTRSITASNYSAVWLNTAVNGVSGTNLLGNLTITLPASLGSKGAYSVHFDHLSASPNGIALFPQTVDAGLVTASDRNGSSWKDGISDAWRLKHFGSVSNVLSDANADADGDGVSNADEFKAGTNPNDIRSRLALVSNAQRDGNSTGLKLKWPTGTNRRYILECSSSMAGGSWSVVSSNILGSGAEAEYIDTRPGTEPRFYRVRVQE